MKWLYPRLQSQEVEELGSNRGLPADSVCYSTLLQTVATGGCVSDWCLKTVSQRVSSLQLL